MVQENSIVKPRIVVIVGPTASGKTGIGIKLAKEINGEIISADSMQIYKHMDIGTAKATTQEMENVPHHLIDIVNPTDSFSVADWVKSAEIKINEIIANGKVPIIVGGTGLYVTSLLKGYSFHSTGENKELREKYQSIYKERGIDALIDKIKELDPNKAKTIDKSKIKYVIRTLEILESENGQEDNNLGERYNYILFGLDLPRDVLYSRINNRVDKMVDAGLLEEFENLVDKYNLTSDCQSAGAIGYRELFQINNGELSKEDAINLIKQHSRNYAKRQLTWFRKMYGLIWVSPNDYEKIETLVKKFIGDGNGDN